MNTAKELIITPGLLARFWAKVDKASSPHGCWLWTAATIDGYGKIRWDNHGPLIRANRLSWIIHYGPIPRGLWVLHNCPGGDNPACVNPSHLWLGAHTDNMKDKVAKGRQRRGEKTPSHKLTETQVKEIRAIDGLSLRTIAGMYGICPQTAWEIRCRQIWKHI